MKDFIVIDFDNTLINNEEEIPTSTIVLFDELRREKKRIIILTDSCLNRVLYYNYSFPFIDYIISSAGSYVYDVVKEKEVYKKNILVSNVNKIINYFYDKCMIYLTDKLNCNLINGDDNNKDVVIINDYKVYLNDNKSSIYKIDLVFDNNESIHKYLDVLNGFNLKININVDENNKTISIIHEDISKLNAVNKLLLKTKKSIKDIVYIGSDLEILENVGVGVVSDKEVSYLKTIATDITSDCNNKGVEKFLSKYYKKVN